MQNTRSLALFLSLLLACGDAMSVTDAGTLPNDSGTAAMDASSPIDGGEPPPTFAQPESALWDASSHTWFVSNIAGEPDGADGVGWIARLEADGTPRDARWLTGLDAPKGLAILDGTLYIADLHQLVVVDIARAEVRERVAFEGAVFLNDVAASADTIFVSDTFGAAVFAFDPASREVSELARADALATANGVLVSGDALLVGTIGDFTDNTDLGNFSRIDLATGDVTTLATEIGKLDGLVADGDTVLATDFRGNLLRLATDGTSELLMSLTESHGLASAADLGFDPVRRVAAVPDLFASQLVLVEVPPAE